ncbi:DUF2662 domain-containing protein [Ktedonosporobacter rubrisoli]|uniref:DUF2662 domain-containing protein n=1 Tax=Ktedonosporobacter rubrisoli TaxID=2509675 RepID=A0A4P6K3D5_KTERU|nr:DUF3662 and FHA domain-containing protein [Ktedonosporobacter rubrisoli]QBD81996.1 DUF2662 domain-containing protein [Ktedonosporobacter rubrisoli]
MKARQNPLTKFEAFMQRIIEGPFARLFPSRLEPVELARKLERAMEDNTLLQGEGRRLAPDIYDIYLSIKDHQQLSPGQAVLIKDWQNQLVEFARHRHYTLRTMPVIRLHSDSSLSMGIVRIETELADKSGGAEAGIMATQALSAEQIAQLRAQIPPGQSLPGIQPSPVPQQGGRQQQASATNNPTRPAASAPMPQAWLTIRLPQSGQQIYRIEKPIINIGRQLSNDIIVEDKRVSRYHAQLKYQPDGQFVIFDLGSTNGITINNTPHMRQYTLRNGDHFVVGSYDFYFERR